MSRPSGTWRASEAVNRPSAWLLLGFVLSLVGCEQLGNPPQYSTGPTKWQGSLGHIVTHSRSFRNEKTIRRLVADGLEDFDYADPSIGPSQTFTIVIAVPRAVRRSRKRKVRLVTVFEMEGRRPISKTWSAPLGSERWSAAFALPAPPADAVTSVAP